VNDALDAGPVSLKRPSLSVVAVPMSSSSDRYRRFSGVAAVSRQFFFHPSR